MGEVRHNSETGREIRIIQLRQDLFTFALFRPICPCVQQLGTNVLNPGGPTFWIGANEDILFLWLKAFGGAANAN
jgi:hypothetical protein